MKICFVSPVPLKYSGGGVRIHYIAEELLKRNNKVEVIAPRWKNGRNFSEHKYSLIEVDPALSFLRPLSILYFTITAYAKNRNYDVVDVTDPTPFPLWRSKKSPVIVRTINELYGARHYFEESRLFFPLALLSSRMSLYLPYDAILTVSEFSKSQLIRNYVNPDKIFVIPNGIDFNFYESGKYEKYDRPTIVCVSRLSKKKRLHILLEIVEYLKEDIPNLQLVLVGEGSDRVRLEKLISIYGIDGFVKFKGYVSEEEKREILHRSHIFCFPSEQEGFGLVPLEAMASGLPVIESKISPLLELHNDAAIYANTPEEFAEMVKTLFFNPEFYAEQSRKSKQKAKEFSWGRTALQIEEFYKNLLEGKKNRKP